MRQRHPQSAFTLLEVMVALAILGMSLVVLLEIVTNNLRSTNHAKLVTTGTFLARGKMVEVETLILEDGFQDSDQEESGTFEGEGFPAFGWTTTVERIKLPSDLLSQAQEAAGKADSDGESGDTQGMLAGMLGGAFSSMLEPIRIGLEESIRRVTVTVSWNELGRGEQSLEVVAFFTDAAKLNSALPDLAGLQGATGTGTGGSAGGSSRATGSGGSRGTTR